MTSRSPSSRGVVATGGDLLRVDGLRKQFPGSHSLVGLRPGGPVTAVDDVSFDLRSGETLGLVGESGSGKTTTGRLVLRLVDPTSGTISFDGRDITKDSGKRLRDIRKNIQPVFQDVTGSLSSRMAIEDIIAEPLLLHTEMGRRERRSHAAGLMERVGLSDRYSGRYSYELSGGQRQRVGIARALATSPRLMVLDEPVSALDVSTQSQVVNLLSELQQSLGVAYLFIAHDLYIVHHVSKRIAVMYLGAIVELGTADQVYGQPRHPYTQALLSSIPSPDPGLARKRIVLRGDIPSAAAIPPGCRFHTRCPYAFDKCESDVPPLLSMADGGRVACHLHTDGPSLAGASVNELLAAADR